MRTISPENEEHQTNAGQAYREELAERSARGIRVDGKVEPLDGIHLNRSSTPTQPVHGVSEPSLCVIAQRSEEVLPGESVYRPSVGKQGGRLRHVAPRGSP